LPEVRYCREDVVLRLDVDEPGPREWPDVKNPIYLGSLGLNGELWLIQGKLIAVWRKREK